MYVALVEFPRSSFGQKYSYLCDIEDLKEGEPIVVQTQSFYSVAKFIKYTKDKVYVDVAKKWVIQRVDLNFVEEKEMESFLE